MHCLWDGLWIALTIARVRVAAPRHRRVRQSRGNTERHRHRRRVRRAARRPRIDSTNDGVGASDHGAGLPCLCRDRAAARPHRPRSHRASRLRHRPAHRHDLHDARGDLRRSARRGDDLHRALHDLRRHPRAQRRRPLLRRLDDRGDRPLGPRRRTGTNRHGRRVPSRRGLGQWRRQHGDARRGDVAADAARGLSRRHRGRRSGGGGNRRHPGASGHGSRGISHRRVPQHLLSGSDRHRGHSGRALLPVDLSDGRSRLSPARPSSDRCGSADRWAS